VQINPQDTISIPPIVPVAGRPAYDHTQDYKQQLLQHGLLLSVEVSSI
jgi:hypothetical protein